MYTEYSTNSGEEIKIFKYRGAIIGILENGILRKEAYASKHMLQSPKGWAIQEYVFEEAKELKAKWVCIRDLESKYCYWATFSDFNLRGYWFDRGFGRQVVLPLKWFIKLTDGDSPDQQLPLAF